MPVNLLVSSPSVVLSSIVCSSASCAASDSVLRAPVFAAVSEIPASTSVTRSPIGFSSSVVSKCLGAFVDSNIPGSTAPRDILLE